MSISSPTTTRVLNPQLENKIMSATEAAALIRSGDQIGMSGFTGSGYPKVVPIELAHRIADAHFHGQKVQVSVFTGASTGPELDGALGMAGGIHSAAALSIGSRNAQAHQRGRNGLHGHSSQPCRPVRGVWISRKAECRADMLIAPDFKSDCCKETTIVL